MSLTLLSPSRLVASMQVTYRFDPLIYITTVSVIPRVMVDCPDEHEWVLVIDTDVTACDTETFGSFVSFLC